MPDINDASNVYEAIKAFGAPVKGLSPRDFANKQLILQIGVAPVRVDIMMDLPGVVFTKAWKNRKRIKYGKTPITIIGLEDIIRSKKRAGRPQDKFDFEKLVRKI